MWKEKRKRSFLNCGNPNFQLDCQNNHTILNLNSWSHYIQSIDVVDSVVENNIPYSFRIWTRPEVAMVVRASSSPTTDNSSLSSIHEALTYGIELSWLTSIDSLCARCYGHGVCSFEGNSVVCRLCPYCYEDVLLSKLGFPRAEDFFCLSLILDLKNRHPWS